MRRMSRGNWVLEGFAEVLAVPVQMLLASTYLPELARIYGLSKSPHSMVLNSSFLFRFSPACAQNRILKRTLMLAHITFCPLHHVILCQRCPCGAPQQLFCRQSHPFTCRKCGLDWADFPRCAAPAEEISLGNKLLSWYEVFFSRGTPDLFTSALKLIRNKLSAKRDGT